MAERFTNIFTVPRLSQLIFDQYYSSDSIDKLDKNQNGEYNYVRQTDAKGNFLYDEIMGENLEKELHAFFNIITQQLAKHFIEVEVKKNEETISIQYRPYILGNMNDWIDELLLCNLANYGKFLKPDEKGNDTTMPFSDFIHYTPSLFGKAFYRPLRKITVKLYGKRKQTLNKQQAVKQRQQIRSGVQTNNDTNKDLLLQGQLPGQLLKNTQSKKQNAPNLRGKQMNINAEKGSQTQKNNDTNEDLLLQAQQSKQLLKNTQSNNLTQVQKTDQQQTNDNKKMAKQQAFQLQNNPVSATRTQQQQKHQRQQQLQRDKEQTIKEIMTLLIQKIDYYDKIKPMNRKKYLNYVNTSRNKKFNQSVKKILSEESLKTLKIVKEKIERFQPQNNYPVNQRRLLTESLDKDKNVTIVALRNKLLGDPYKKLLFGDDFTKQQVGKKNVSKLQNEYTQFSEKYQKEREEATLKEKIAQRKRLEEIRETEQREKRQAARIARQKEELDLQRRKNQLLERGKRQTLQDPGEREELRDYYENNRHKIDGESEISSQQLISLYDEGQNLPVFLKQIKQQKRKCKEHSEKVNQLQKQIQTKSSAVNQLKDKIENDSRQVSRINQKIKKDSDLTNQINEKIKKDSNQISRINQKIKEDSDQINRINQQNKKDSDQISKINQNIKDNSDQIKQLTKVIENLSTTREEQQQKRREFCKNNE